MALASFLLFCVMVIPCHAQGRDALCRNGSGNFEAEFHTGVKLRLGAARKTATGLATRVCEATLSWDKQEITVATGASQLDVDAFGADLGLGVPVVTFQVKQSETECCMAYQIYSLQKPPALLRAITGGGSFSASDTDLDGRVEIWTDDAAAGDGFENLVGGELDFAPTIVLRFERNHLLDVSSEFRIDFDEKIATLRAELDSEDLRDFKNSDGKLASTARFSAGQLHRLRGVKIKVLEIAWSYLYSGREPEAWLWLADMWPDSDVQRLRTAMLDVRAHGIHAQVDERSSGPSPGRKKRAMVFDTTTKRSERSKSEIIPPQPILLRRSAPVASEQGLTDSELLLDLLIDSAGKVRSVEPAGNTKSDPDLIKAATEWKFVTAFKDGRAVASRLRLAVSVKR
ncbi:MAG: hypothetical protein DMG76_14970 [Acidobacteria bacterium]|nr:MAG: hypothetical protein DMG76_14970 [Acidobacteriota bacterium]